jgi:hypothetical protein
MVRITTMIDTAYIGFGALKCKVVYEYLQGDGDTWCEAMEIYLDHGDNKQNMIDYLNDEVIQSLERQCIYINQGGD